MLQILIYLIIFLQLWTKSQNPQLIANALKWLGQREVKKEKIYFPIRLFIFMLYLLNKKRIILNLKKLKKKGEKKKRKKTKAQTRLGFPPPFYTKEPTLTKLAYLRVSFFFLVVKDEFDINFQQFLVFNLYIQLFKVLFFFPLFSHIFQL